MVDAPVHPMNQTLAAQNDEGHRLHARAAGLPGGEMAALIPRDRLQPLAPVLGHTRPSGYGGAAPLGSARRGTRLGRPPANKAPSAQFPHPRTHREEAPAQAQGGLLD